jgi:hypothetical protein
MLSTARFVYSSGLSFQETRLSAATDRAAFLQLARQLFLDAWDVLSQNIRSIVNGNTTVLFAVCFYHSKEPSSASLLSLSQSLNVICLLHV